MSHDHSRVPYGYFINEVFDIQYTLKEGHEFNSEVIDYHRK